MGLAKIDLHTSEGVEEPVGVTCLLGVIVVIQGVGLYFKAQAHLVAQTEVGSNAKTTTQTNLGTIPEIYQGLRTVRSGDSSLYIASLIIAKGDVGTDTTQHAEVEDTVGVVTAEQVGEVEHYVSVRSNVVPLPVIFLATSSDTCLALPEVERTAETYYRAEVIAYTYLGIGRKQVAETNLTQSVLTTNLCLYIPVGIKHVLCLGLLLGRNRYESHHQQS